MPSGTPPGRGLLRASAVLATLALALPAVADEPHAPAAQAQAQPSALDRARHAVGASDYLGARAALAQALAAGTAGPDDLADIYRLTGIVEGALGDRGKSTMAFERWIALDPKAQLPFGTSPKIARPFAAAQAKLRGGPALDVQLETSASPPSITLVVDADALHLVAGARVEVSADHGPERTLEARGSGRITIALPRGNRLDLRAQALDAHGNRVVELGTAEVPIVITGAGGVSTPVAITAPPPRPAVHGAHAVHHRPLWRRWWLWSGASVVAIAGASWAGLSARSEVDRLNAIDRNSTEHTFAEAQRVEGAARRDVVLFDVGAGVAGALAIGAVILYVTKPRAHAETRVGAVPLTGGAAVVLGGRF